MSAVPVGPRSLAAATGQPTNFPHERRVAEDVIPVKMRDRDVLDVGECLPAANSWVTTPSPTSPSIDDRSPLDQCRWVMTDESW